MGRAVARGGAGYASLGGDIAVRGDASAPSCHLSQKKSSVFHSISDILCTFVPIL